MATIRPRGDAKLISCAVIRSWPLMKLKNTLRWMKGEELITHLGLEYYD
jgi:hypothetical protein